MESNVKIEFNNVENIKPIIRSSRNRLKAVVSMEEFQKEDLIRHLWEEEGDDWLFKIIESEGYKIKEYQTNRTP